MKNLRTLIICMLVFTGLSYYYFHHDEATKIAREESEKAGTKIIALNDHETINWLSIQYDDFSCALSLSESGWMIVEPLTDTAEPFIVNGLVQTITIDARVRDLSDTSFDYAAIGLAPARIRVGIGYNDKRRFLLLGDTTYVGDTHYARWEDSDSVFLVSKNFYEVFRKNLMTLRAKNIIGMSPQEVDAFSIEWNDDILRFIKKDVGEGKYEWWIDAPYQNKADEEKVNEVLSDMSRLMIQSFYDTKTIEDSDVKLAGTKKRLVLKSGQNEVVLSLGAVTEDTKEIFASVSTKPRVIGIAYDMINAIHKDADHYVDKHIARFEPETITSFSFMKDDRMVEYSKEDGGWVKAGDTPEKLSAEKGYPLDDMVFLLANLQYEKMLTPDSPTIQQLTKETLSNTVTVRGADREHEKSYSFYVFQDSYLVTMKNDPNYFTINKDLYDEYSRLISVIIE